MTPSSPVPPDAVESLLAGLLLAHPLDADALIGAFAGALLVASLSRSRSFAQRICSVFVSLVAGYFSAAEIVLQTPLTSTGVAAFLGASTAIGVTLRLRQRLNNGAFPPHRAR
ncbi:putative holin [Robbsia sp. KACC 23696]|uniref:putative holin n=1 Tax=Robbsia sp. KACC 23696 TaxID=3149231 RepID=UPI00325B9BB8